jgi:hypothetical protein
MKVLFCLRALLVLGLLLTLMALDLFACGGSSGAGSTRRGLFHRRSSQSAVGVSYVQPSAVSYSAVCCPAEVVTSTTTVTEASQPAAASISAGQMYRVECPHTREGYMDVDGSKIRPLPSPARPLPNPGSSDSAWVTPRTNAYLPRTIYPYQDRYRPYQPGYNPYYPYNTNIRHR